MSAPLVIGGVGGSGTGTVARIVARVRYVGERLTPAHDALELANFDWRWARRHVRTGDVPAAMRADLDTAVARHLAPLAGSPRPWGWKHPHSILLVPLLVDVWPELRFVHVVRDGRDMAFSGNRNQLQRYGDLAGADPGARPAVRAMAYWAWANARAADHGRELLGERYLHVRLEDLCDAPRAVALALLRFAGAGAEAHELAREAAWLVRRPPTVGRWRRRPEAVVAAATRAGAGTLERFGYETLTTTTRAAPDGSTW